MAQKKSAAKNTGTKKKTSSAPKKSESQNKKSSSGTAPKGKTQEKKSVPMNPADRQKWAIGLMAGAVLMICIAFIEGESLWRYIHLGMFAFFGTGTYVLPIMLIYVSIMMAMDKPLGSVTSNLIGVGIYVLLLCSAVHIFSNNDGYLSTEGLWSQIATAWSAYDDFPNSGLFGAIVGGILAKLAGKVGAAIINVILLVVLTMLLTGMTLARVGRLITKPVKKVGESASDIFSHSIERSQEKGNPQENQGNNVPEQANQNEDSSKKTNPAFTFPWETDIPDSGENPQENAPAPENVQNNPMPMNYGGQPGYMPPAPGTYRTPEGFLVDEHGVIIDEMQMNPNFPPQINPQENNQFGNPFPPFMENNQPPMNQPPFNQPPMNQPPFGQMPYGAPMNNQPMPPEFMNQGNMGNQNFNDIINEVNTQHENMQMNPPDLFSDFPSPSQNPEPPQVQEETVDTQTEPKVNKEYHLPPSDCLEIPVHKNEDNYNEELQSNAQKLLFTLDSFNIKAKITNISRGPSVTRYELLPDPGVRISKITNLSDDIALRLAAPAVRIEAPIPGKAAIGIEVPNVVRSMVYMREIIDSPQFKNAKSKLNVALGKDIAGNIICADLAKMPHLLIAGTTGSGKSVCINTMIASILYNATPDEVKLLMIDPKQVEFTVYNGIAHLAVPVVSDPKKASGALTWAVNEMTHRYNLFAEKNVRDIKGYNKLAEKDSTLKKMQQIVIFIDELSDLMMVAPNEVEDAICRLAQMARAAGMHLVIATQRPSVNVITGIIKANIPSRIALSVSSGVDSRTILDTAGAEKLLGNGDMLFSPIGSYKPQRVQGCFISDEEVEKLVNYVKNEAESTYDEEIMTEIEKQAAMAGNNGKGAAADSQDSEYEDELFPNAVEVVIENKMASTTLLQRKLKLGYARAARIMDELEAKGIIGPFEGSKPRKVLITRQQWMEKCALTGSGTNNN